LCFPRSYLSSKNPSPGVRAQYMSPIYFVISASGAHEPKLGGYRAYTCARVNGRRPWNQSRVLGPTSAAPLTTTSPRFRLFRLLLGTSLEPAFICMYRGTTSRKSSKFPQAYISALSLAHVVSDFNASGQRLLCPSLISDPWHLSSGPLPVPCGTGRPSVTAIRRVSSSGSGGGSPEPRYAND
jgi:hypothetical protein